MKNHKNRKFGLVLTGTILSSLIPVTAFAQSVPQEERNDPPQAEVQPDRSIPADDAPTPGSEETDPPELIVTGSRIRNTEYSSTSPVTIIDVARQAELGKTQAAEILQNSPAAAVGGQVNNTFTGFVVGGGAGINTISLRGLGDQRSLVLLNGRRLPPSGVGGSVGPVDLSSIPSAAISRYEVLKDGASSVYGSDAVAGVVNAITRSKVEGLSLNSSGIVSQHGGAESFNVNGAWGRAFEGGHISISASYTEQGALRSGDRSDFACPVAGYRNPDGTRADLIDPATGTYKCFLNQLAEGAVYTYFPLELAGAPIVYNVFRIEPNSIDSNVRGFRPVNGLSEISYADPRQLRETIFSPLRYASVFVQGQHRPEWLGAELYTEILYTRRTSEQDAFSVLSPFYARTSPLNPFQNAILTGNEQFGETGLIARPQVLYGLSARQDVDVYRFLIGGRGSVFGWSYDVYASHAESDGRYASTAIYNDRVAFGTGTNQDTLTDLAGGVCGTGAPAGCVPLDLFGRATLEDGSFSQAVRDYYFTRDSGQTRYRQSIFEVSATGDVMALPHGSLSAALGATVRRESVDDDPGELSRAHNIWGRITAGATKGSDTIKEIYGELEGPILRNIPYVEDLKFNVSGRYSHYDSVGGAGTYKVGLNWAINSTFRLRGTHGTSFRAPALYELYLNDQRGFLAQNQVDPCIGFDQAGADGVFLQNNERIRNNCASAVPERFAGGLNRVNIIMNGGGDELDAERSTASTVGIAITPPRSGVKLAVDYWRIRIEDQISNIGAGAAYECYNAADFPTSGFCDLFTRDPVDFGIDSIDTRYRNIPSEQSSGVDIVGSFEREFNAGTLSLNLLGSYILEHKFQSFSGSEVRDYVGTLGYPEFVGNANAAFRFRTLLISGAVNYVGPTSNIGFLGETGVLSGGYADGASYTAKTRAFVTEDLFVGYSAKTWQLLVGVINIADAKAPRVGEGISFQRLGNYARGSQYSTGYIGRQFFVRLSKAF